MFSKLWSRTIGNIRMKKILYHITRCIPISEDLLTTNFVIFLGRIGTWWYTNINVIIVKYQVTFIYLNHCYLQHSFLPVDFVKVLLLLDELVESSSVDFIHVPLFCSHTLSTGTIKLPIKVNTNWKMIFCVVWIDCK